VISARPPPTGFQSPSEYHRACSPGLTVQARPLSWGSLPFGASRTSGAHSPRACLTRYVAPSGFHSLLAPCFSGRLPALFHAGNAHGVSRPSEPFPQLQPDPSRDRVALLPFTVAIRLGFRALSPESGSVAPAIHISGTAGTRCSPGLLPLQGLLLSRDGSPFGSPPLLGFTPAFSVNRQTRGCPPESPSRESRPWALSSPPTLLGSLASSFPSGFPAA
jgi:hypothetical protein